MNCLQLRYPLSVENPRAGTFSGTPQSLSRFLSKQGPDSSIPEDVLKSIKELPTTYVKFMDEQKINLRNIQRKEHEASLTEDELKEERLDKWFALTEQMLKEWRCKQYQLLATQYFKQFENVPYE